MTDESKAITKHTMISIGLVVMVVVAVARMSWCASDVYRSIDDNKARIERQDRQIDDLTKGLTYLEKAMVRIETKLGTLPPTHRSRITGVE